MTRLIAILALTACAGRHASRLEGRYDLGNPGAGWEGVRPGSADKAWRHADSGATIYADSNCAERFDDDPLDSLLDRLVLGVAQGDPVGEQASTLDDRDALMRAWNGEIDGVPVSVAALVIKKDFCVYDVVYIAPPTAFEQGRAAFETVAAGFRSR